jgi:hypothetical protein
MAELVFYALTVGRNVGFAAALVIATACGVGSAWAGFGAPPSRPAAPSEGADDGRLAAPERDAPAALDSESAPAKRYAELDRGACEAELSKRAVPFVPVEDARGVLAPVRLKGPLRGVTFHCGVPPAQRASTPWEIIDCRLALALDDFAVQLAAHDVVEVLHYSIYRPPPVAWPADKIAARHPGALAIDAATFTKRDGTKLDVERDFHGRVGSTTCGEGAEAHPLTAEAAELRQIVCEAAEAKLFNVALTPDYNFAHHNHFHLEVTAGAKWFMVR